MSDDGFTIVKLNEVRKIYYNSDFENRKIIENLIPSFVNYDIFNVKIKGKEHSFLVPNVHYSPGVFNIKYTFENFSFSHNNEYCEIALVDDCAVKWNKICEEQNTVIKCMICRKINSNNKECLTCKSQICYYCYRQGKVDCLVCQKQIMYLPKFSILEKIVFSGITCLCLLFCGPCICIYNSSNKKILPEK